jgi:secondary thiamine-phosphate synthase enzyme
MERTLAPYFVPLEVPRTQQPCAALLRLSVASAQPVQLLDITDQVAALVGELGEWDGIACVFSRHTTAAVRVQEDESLLLEDLRQFLLRLAPPEAPYGHNDFRVRSEHMHPDERPNGHAHCLHLLLGTSASVPVAHGELQLGTWQRLFLIELDGPRPRREVLVQLNGVRSSIRCGAGR